MSKDSDLPLKGTESSPLSPRQSSEPSNIPTPYTWEALMSSVLTKFEDLFNSMITRLSGIETSPDRVPADNPTSEAQKTMGNMLTEQKQFQISMILTVAGTIIALFALIIPILMWSIDSKVSGLEAKMEAGQVETREQFKTLGNQLEEMDRRYTIRQEYYEKIIDERTKK